MSNDLYTLNKAIKNMTLLKDETLFLELNGFKFYGLQDDGSARYIYKIPEYSYGNPNKLTRLMEAEKLGHFGDFLCIILDVIIKNSYEKHYKLRKGDVVVDVGANVGVFTVKASKEVGSKGKVIAIEPDQKNLECLKRNIRINRLKNVEIIPKGAWDKKERKRFYLSNVPGWHSLIDEKYHNYFGFIEHRGYEKWVEIETGTIDEILEELGIERVDFMKIDTEGVESEAIKGAYNSLRNNNVKLAIESHMRNGKLNDKTIVSQLEGMEYKIEEMEGREIYAKNNLIN